MENNNNPVLGRNSSIVSQKFDKYVGQFKIEQSEKVSIDEFTNEFNLEQSEEELTDLDRLDRFLSLLSTMKKIGIRRKILFLEKFINAFKEQKIDRAEPFWICGLFIPELQNWEFQGLFSTEQKAIDACKTNSYFIAPAQLDEIIMDESGDCPGAFYPLENN